MALIIDDRQLDERVPVRAGEVVARRARRCEAGPREGVVDLVAIVAAIRPADADRVARNSTARVDNQPLEQARPLGPRERARAIEVVRGDDQRPEQDLAMSLDEVVRRQEWQIDTRFEGLRKSVQPRVERRTRS